MDTGDLSITVTGLRWDQGTNTTTARLNVPAGAGVLYLSFTNTKRTADAATNTGITNLKVIRPGYAAGTGQVYSHEFLDSLAPFSVLRFMDFTDTNGVDDKAYPAVTNWSDRHVITDATQQPTGGKAGFAWEYAILLANQSGKDMWINIPASATDDYIRQLAQLLKARLNPELKVYIEHSNEVWNQLFPQFQWNSDAAAAEGLPGNLQRHVKRLGSISNTFRDVFGAGAINQRIRVILAWWTLKPGDYDAGLTWMQNNVGTPSSMLYGLAQSHYFNDQGASATADPAGVLAAMRADSDGGLPVTQQMASIAAKWGLKLTVYEGGPDNGGGSTTNIGNRILANRDAGMKDLLLHDIRDKWFSSGGDLYMYFTLSGAYSRFGCWGATEDIVNLNTPKYNALLELVRPPAAQAAVADIRNAASGAADVAPGAFFSIYGSNLTALSAQWDGAIVDGVTLPTALAGVRVRINNRDAYVSYASPTQINAVAPPDSATGSIPVDVITAAGKITKTVTMAAVSPGFYGYALNGTTYAWAVVATEPGPVYIAQAEAFGAGYQSRPARAGDILSFFVNGLGGLGADFPVGKALAAAYAIDAGRVSVTVDGAPATVSYAGAIYPGEYQVNVTVPALARSGDVPVTISTGGKSTQAMLRVTASGAH